MATRAERRDTTEAAILAAALKLLAEGGPEALTVRGVARELSLVPSALYRYLRSRDELITALIEHAFNELADTVQAACDALPAEDLRGRWRAFAHAERNWMHANPHAWVLAQGMPIPGYEPDDERLHAPATRIHLMLLRLAADAEAAGWRPSVPDAPQSAIPGLPAMLAAAGVQVSEATAMTGLAAWHLLAGVLYSERFHQAGWDLIDTDRYFEVMVEASERIIFGPRP